MTYPGQPMFRSRRYMLSTRDLEPLVRNLALESGWTLVAERASDEQRNVARVLMWEIIPGLTVGYYDEPLAEASCLIVRSARDLAEVREFEAFLKHRLDILTDSELLTPPPDAQPGTREEALFLLRLGLGAPVSFDNQYFDVLSSATQSNSADIRFFALRGITYTEWPQFRPILQWVAKRDSDRSVRELANQIISIFDRLGLVDSQ